MTLYLDSADRAGLERHLDSGLYAGITTNPLILRRAGLAQGDLPALHDWAVAAGARTVFLQAIGTEPAEIARGGRRLRALSEHVVVKVVATRAGLMAARELAADDVPVLVTAVYHASQALLAAAAGADYIAPYLGRMIDAGRDGLAQIISMHHILAASTTDILVASIRTPDQIVTLASAGLTAFTVGLPLADSLLADELTIAAAAEFEQLSSDQPPPAEVAP